MLTTRYRIVVTGEAIHIPSVDGDEPLCAFATTRFLRADSPDTAKLAAIQSVSEAWESDPNLALSPKPILQVVFIARVASPFKRSRPNKGYSFVSCPEDLPEAVDIEIAASSGWFF